ncbi:thiamine pyrophosphate-dependent dehydrogenase E1 component subunit alpha [Hymenobacter volaticus]|uniref:2-oxoisovalerate dehydrogenase subunit alpha n=1 Tax=Hymenobacter volaticus TaxID=2932254 RepID=A0ABY4G0L1_9BACT|nr:thiamine pyrophosphate-dependent dehydrogenase E1 component subunit alpha [Hymenobacter volaticus]UOQ64325.1 thiamine pyrophosphate-dependent dehydrogenase E1 component subunit alpha [Hymenobacter volaticus]
MYTESAPPLEPAFTTQPDRSTWQRAYRLMHTAAEMARLFEENKAVTAKYVHATARGHEAVQLAAAFHLRPVDYAAPYYRDDAFLIGLGLQPYELILQLMAKRDDPFSGGRTYYSHPSLRRAGFPTIPHQSSATGMQAIPATGMAHGIKYLESNSEARNQSSSVVLCSIGDGAMTEGEVSEALQMAVLHQLPIIYLVQDNDWGISATGREMRTMDAYEFAAGFKGLHRLQVDGADFQASYTVLADAFEYVRARRGPVLVHAKCPLLGHHTSGVRREWYRGDNLAEHNLLDPLPRLHQHLQTLGFTETALAQLAAEARTTVEADYQRTLAAPAPDPATFADHEFAPPP